MMAMEAPLVTAIPRNFLRPDDTRMPRAFRFDDHDRPRAASADTRVKIDARELSGALEDSPPRDDDRHTPLTIKSDATLLSLDETAELCKRKVADAQQHTDQALEGEGVPSVVKPKLTLDLGHSSIARLPETVVDLIKDEVDRLSLSHNQIWHIPLRFSECTHLRYLNIRSNVFREIPRGVYKLPLLEILDISRNKVRKISKDIRNLTSLRVFAVVHNRIEDLPVELCEMKNLQICKIAENPLRFKLKKVVEAKEAEVSFSEMNDNEKETAITTEIKRFLRESLPIMAPIDVEAAQQLEDSPIETPKPTKRMPSSRFPVIPSAANGDMRPDPNKVSPNQANPPPIPTRSHYRMTSGAGTGLALKRPGITALISNNERNRSNSESVLQTSNAVRVKRMGMLRNKQNLDSIEESKANRLSHLRGFSHASALKRNGAPPSPGGGSSSSPNSPREVRLQRNGFVKRLSSLPEHKTDAPWQTPIMEGAKGILYALYQVHPHISGLIAAIRGKEGKRSSLEITFFAAATQVDRLNEALDRADAVDPEDAESVDKAEGLVQEDCHRCITAYIHVSAQLQVNIKQIVKRSNARYVRSLMLLLYGSIMEIRNAITNFGFEVRTVQRGHNRQKSSGPRHPIQTIPEEFSTPQQSARAATPTRDTLMHQRPGMRLRSDTTIIHPGLNGVVPPQPSIPASLPTPINLTGTTMNGTYISNASSYINGNGLNGHGVRSRSNSRNTSQASTAYSSVTSTPRSVEGFHLPRTNAYPMRVNPGTGMTDQQEEQLFGHIFLSLTRAYESALQCIPIAKEHFIRCIEAAEDTRQPKAIHDLWSTLIYRCKLCLDVSEALQLRLTSMRIKDAEGGRSDPSFWQLCKTFLQNFVELVQEMKEVRALRLLPAEVIAVLRPVQKSCRDAGRLFDGSPWRSLTDANGSSLIPAMTPWSSAGSRPGTAMSNVSTDTFATMNSHGHVNGNGLGVALNGTTKVVHLNGVNGHTKNDSFSSYATAISQYHVNQATNPSAAPTPILTNGHFAPAVQPLNPTSAPSSLPTSSASSHPPHGSTPLISPLPATPLSAALGPAAQATMPHISSVTNGHANGNGSATLPPTPLTATSISSVSTNGEGARDGGLVSSSDRFFKGDVFQRADMLASMGGGAFFGGRR